MKVALDLPLPAKEFSKGGFSPTSRFIPSEADQFQEDGTLHEEFATDVPLVGCRGDRSVESFQIAKDVYIGYFHAIRPANEGTNHPFWIARALTNPNSDVSHPNCIWMQYWTRASTHYVDAKTYVGWDSTSGHIWHKIGGLIPFGPTRIVLWVHGNLGFTRGLRIHECEFLCYKLQILRPQ